MILIFFECDIVSCSTQENGKNEHKNTLKRGKSDFEELTIREKKEGYHTLTEQTNYLKETFRNP